MMAYYELEPFGEWRGDLQAGIIASTLANVYRKKGSDPFKPEQFMPKFRGLEDEGQKQSVEEMKSVLQLIAAAHKDNKRTPGTQVQRNLKRKARQK